MKRIKTLRSSSNAIIWTLILAFGICAPPSAQGSDNDKKAPVKAESMHDDVSLTPGAATSAGVRTEKAIKFVLEETIKVPTRVAYNGEAIAHVGTSVEGRISELPAQVGMVVQKGDVLAIIDSPALGEAQSDFIQKRSAVEVEKTTVEVAHKALDRARELGAGQGITQTEFQTREGNLKIAQGVLITAEAASKAAGDKLHILGMSQPQINELLRSNEVSPRLEIRSPIAGQVVEREVTLGEVVGPERDSLMVIANLTSLWVLADVTEIDVPRMAVGNSARLTFDALPGMSFSAKVASVSAELNSKTRSGLVRLVVSGPPILEEEKDSLDCQHHLKRKGCPFCNPSLVTEGGMCKEHSVPEALCYLCNSTLILAFKAEGDWCREHDRPDSQCDLCFPGYKEHYTNGEMNSTSLAAASKHTLIQIAEYKAKGDWCAEHGVPESQCAICNPELAKQPSAALEKPTFTSTQIAEYKAKGDWCAGHGVPESQCLLCNPGLADNHVIESSVPVVPQQPASLEKQLLRPGMFGQAEIWLSPPPGRHSSAQIIVPTPALQRMGGGTSVFVELAEAPGTYRRRPVAVGRRVGGFVPILSGIEEGELVVIAGAFILKAQLGKSSVVGCCAE
jgi:cobalt-zinc-cadmium efflux system membrane fusion protein